MITLYDLAGHDPALRFSPYCWRIRMALAHKGLDATTVPWRFSDAASLPGAPVNQKVPVLTDRDIVVAGSTDIALYLENRYANGPSLFGGAVGEAHARFIIAWADNTLIPALAPLVAPCVLPVLHPADQTYFRSSREARFGTTFEQLVAEQRKLNGTWEKITPGAKNEALDLMVMTHALAHLMGLARMNWDSPPSWAAPWDQNIMVRPPETPVETLAAGLRAVAAAVAPVAPAPAFTPPARPGDDAPAAKPNRARKLA